MRWSVLGICSRIISRNLRRPSCRARLGMQRLEDRSVPANFGSIGGTVYTDQNANNTLDAGEGIPGVVVTLTGTVTLDGSTVNATATTAIDGGYTFINVQPGTYAVSAGPITGIGASGTGAEGTVTVSGVQIALQQNLTRDLEFDGYVDEFSTLRNFLHSSRDNLPLNQDGGSGSGKATFRNNVDPTVSDAIDDVTVLKNAANTVIDLAGHFADADYTNSQVRLNTTAGAVNIELFDAKAPRTVANFFNYVNDGDYDGTIFHRLISGFALQGGGFTFNDPANTVDALPDDGPVQNEFSTSNTIHTVAMAKVPGDPDSATNEFFINLGNNLGLNTQNGGFTVFGKLVAAADQTVVNNLAQTPTFPVGGFEAIPLANYSGNNFPTDTTAANYLTINSVDVVRRDEFLTYSVVTNTNSALVSATVAHNRLVLDYADGKSGVASITIRATDRFGATVEDTFTVTVQNRVPSVTVQLAQTTLGTDGVMTATVTPTDPDGDSPLTFTYAWRVNGILVTTTTNSTLTTDTLDLSQPGFGDIGQSVNVLVTPFDGTDFGSGVLSDDVVIA